MHKQFGHCAPSRLKDLIKRTGKTNAQVLTLVDQVSRDCDVCVRYGRTKLRPVVSLPLSSRFLDATSLNLHQLTALGPSVWYVHIIDIFTRFRSACLIYDKAADTVLNTVSRKYVLVHGSPKTVISDNGGEFDNDKFRSKVENFSLKLISVIAESPCSNRFCEKHNQILTKTFLTTRHTTEGCDDDLCLQQALLVKNCLLNYGVFTPYQLRCGNLWNPLSVSTNNSPALDNETSSGHLRQYLAALHRARVACMAEEASERIKKALRKNIRGVDQFSELGDDVFYQRRTNEWHGPGKISGLDGKVVFVRHSGRF